MKLTPEERVQALALAQHLTPDTLLKRADFARVLTALGYPITASTLAAMIVKGTGPEVRYFGKAALYQWGSGLEWAKARLSAPVRSTSEKRKAA